MFIVHNSIGHGVEQLDPLGKRRNMKRAVGNQTGCFKMTALTLVHVVLSLAGIGSGFIVVFGLIAGKRLDGLTALFLASTVATSLTGFLFPFHKLLPSHVVGIVSLVVLGISILARYARHLTGAWRWIYAVNVVIGLYLNVFVLVAQVFKKVPALKAMAPTQSEAPFVVAQVMVMALFVVLRFLPVNRFLHRTGRGAVAFC